MNSIVRRVVLIYKSVFIFLLHMHIPGKNHFEEDSTELEP